MSIIKRRPYYCSECGRTALLNSIWLFAWWHCPSCGANSWGTILRVKVDNNDR